MLRRTTAFGDYSSMPKAFSKRFVPTIRWISVAECDDIFVPSEAILVPSELNIAIVPFWSSRCLHKAGVKKPNENRIISLRKSGDTTNASCLGLRNQNNRLAPQV